jgi:hypothetical protein
VLAPVVLLLGTCTINEDLINADSAGIQRKAQGCTSMAKGSCTHITGITTIVQAKRHECEECVKIGSDWVHLRTCQSCGVTLCCDSSRNSHATKHARATSHPVIASAEPGEQWLYCYSDDAFAEY